MGEANPKPTGRRLELDAVRGLMLVWITLTHLPTAASTYVNQPFGIVSAAEGFIFLSALFTGRIYFRMAEHDGYRAMTFKLWLRTLRLYRLPRAVARFCVSRRRPHRLSRQSPGLAQPPGFLFLCGAKTSHWRSISFDLSSTAARHSAHVHYISGLHVVAHFCWRAGSDGDPFCG